MRYRSSHHIAWTFFVQKMEIGFDLSSCWASRGKFSLFLSSLLMTFDTSPFAQNDMERNHPVYKPSKITNSVPILYLNIQVQSKFQNSLKKFAFYCRYEHMVPVFYIKLHVLNLQFLVNHKDQSCNLLFFFGRIPEEMREGLCSWNIPTSFAESKTRN